MAKQIVQKLAAASSGYEALDMGGTTRVPKEPFSNNNKITGISFLCVTALNSKRFRPIWAMVMFKSEVCNGSRVAAVYKEFLLPQELDALRQHVLANESYFQASAVLSNELGDPIINYWRRRSMVSDDLGDHRGVILDRIVSVLPSVFKDLALDRFRISFVEAQITASNDGDFFKSHIDNALDPASPVYLREVTYVFYFWPEPKSFTGGELVLHSGKQATGRTGNEGMTMTIVPENNSIVFFASSTTHEVLPVRCPSGKFADSRFTVNGWVHRLRYRFPFGAGPQYSRRFWCNF